MLLELYFMTKLKAKSEENFNAGIMLYDNNSYATSIHCFYYSCIQAMIHNIISQLNMSENSIGRNIGRTRIGSHNWYINTIRNHIESISDERAETFYEKIQELKGFRVKADYKNIEIPENISMEARDDSEKILEILNEVFNENS